MNHVIRARWAVANANGDFICVATCSGYANAKRDYQGVQHLLASGASDDALGLAVLDALSRSRFVLPAPRDDVWIHPDATFDLDLYDYKKSSERYQAWVADLMAHFGYRTRRALFKNMMNCLISDAEGMLTFEPMHHVKLEAWEGMRGQVESVVIPISSSPTEIGAALRLAFSRCT